VRCLGHGHQIVEEGVGDALLRDGHTVRAEGGKVGIPGDVGEAARRAAGSWPTGVRLNA
jgi:hypothetical protein